MNIKKSILLRVRIAFLVTAICALAITVKVLYIQIQQGEHWRQKAADRGIEYRIIKATRGNIYDNTNNLLVTSIPFYKLSMDPTIAERKIYRAGIDSLSGLLAKYFKEKTSQEYKQFINDARIAKKRYITLANRNLDNQGKKLIEKWPIFRYGKGKGGVVFEKEEQRFAPFKWLAKRTIGYLNEQGRGIVGLEYSFDKYLAGRDGEALFERMPGGSWKPVRTEIKPEDGLDVYTTLDVNIQDAAQIALFKTLVESDADFGSAIVMEVETGEIKAMANLGRVDKGKYAENYNYAIGDRGSTDPGSTFKLASMMALLEETNLELQTKVETGDGTFKFSGVPLNDPKEGGYGTITLQEVFENSSSIGVAKLINEYFKTRPQVFIEYLEKFKLTTPLHFQIAGEAAPYIKRPTDPTWSGISLPWMAIGYETKLSPLQTLTFYNAVANNGKMIQPLLVKHIKKADEIIQEFKAVVISEKICSDKTLQKLHTMLEGVVERGTAKIIKTPQYKLAGKTGTSQKFKDGKYTRSYYSSFAGYFPAEKPKYSCIVIIDNPRGFRQFGGDVAAPVFREIADKIFASDIAMHPKIALKSANMRGNIPIIQSGKFEDLRFICNELGISNHAQKVDDWVAGEEKNYSITWRNVRVSAQAVPNVVGMSLKDALYILENKGLKVVHQGKGRVVQQSQQAGTQLLRGSKIRLRLG